MARNLNPWQRQKALIPGSIRTQFLFPPSPQLLYLALSAASFLPVATTPIPPMIVP
ncbi:hypothetical protein EYZ11_003398 [Aspergillus tanneri]|uniref:Uncharacterized protein n=1 Tax=Aspergillus tanneri TaxID=1220188 RepID=A0A4S3JNL5_9EURO|nr:hypothetical protein EYZ11_003398 [Aspergillus tanneri]